MSGAHIKPTVGRVVLCQYGNGPQTCGLITGIVSQDSDIAPAQIFVSVHSPLPGEGVVTIEMPLLEDEDPRPDGWFAYWMSYQKDQATKATNNTAPHVERMKLELRELAERLQRLDDFVSDNDKFRQFPQVQQRLLVDQYQAMLAYSTALAGRIALS